MHHPGGCQRPRPPAVEQAFNAGYIMVDWGAAFALEHARLFPDMPAPEMRMNCGALARRYPEQAEGSAYLAEQMLAAAGNGGKPLYRVRSGSYRSDLVRQVQELL